MNESQTQTAIQNQIDSSENVKSHYYTAGDGCYVRLSPTAWTILSGRDSGRSFEDIAQQLSSESQQEVTAENVENAWEYLQTKVLDIRKKSSPVRAGFWLRLPLLSKSLVTKVSGLLRPAFHPAVAAALLSFIVIAGLVYYFNYHKHTTPLRLEHIVFGYLLYICSIVIHEFGHSTACRYFGAQPSGIGFTLYLIYPAFYSDVSDAWRLRRWQRIIVDLSGMYFQFVIGAVFALGWHFTGWRPFRIAVFGILAGLLINLNPVLRFDGYWVLCDVLGVTNLGRQPSRMMKNLILRLRGKQTPPSPWPAKIGLILSFYSVAWFAFVFWFLWRISPLLFGSFGNYPQLVRDTVTAFQNSSPEFNPRPLVSLLISTAIIFAISRMLWVMGLRSVFKRLANNFIAHMGGR